MVETFLKALVAYLNTHIDELRSANEGHVEVSGLELTPEADLKSEISIKATCGFGEDLCSWEAKGVVLVGFSATGSLSVVVNIDDVHDPESWGILPGSLGIWHDSMELRQMAPLAQKVAEQLLEQL